MKIVYFFKALILRLFNPFKKHNYKKDNPEYAKTIRPNKKFKNAFKGKRCFVIGNGPSLNNVDFSSLKNEVTFTVNQLPRNPSFADMKTNFHVWGDRVFFDLDLNDDGDRDLFEVMKKANTDDHKPKVLYEYRAKKMIEKNGLDKILDIDYFAIHSLSFSRRTKKIRMDKLMPDFPTVTQVIICMAVYMGFSEIYLLGCDCTGFVNIPQARLNKTEQTLHSYELTDAERKRLVKQANGKRIRNELFEYVKIFDRYEELFYYCQKNGVALFNATDTTLLESIPRIKLEDVLSDGNTRE